MPETKSTTVRLRSSQAWKPCNLGDGVILGAHFAPVELASLTPEVQTALRVHLGINAECYVDDVATLRGVLWPEEAKGATPAVPAEPATPPEAEGNVAEPKEANVVDEPQPKRKK